MLPSCLLVVVFLTCTKCVFSVPLLEETDQLIASVNASQFSGNGTYYKVGPGSCGESDDDNEDVVAINKDQMANGKNPNDNPLCDKIVNVTGDHGSTSARVVDTCPSCKSGGIDMSPTVFKKVCGSLAEGVCNVKWSYI